MIEVEQKQKRKSIHEVVEEAISSTKSRVQDRLEEIQTKEGKRFSTKQYNAIMTDAYRHAAYNHARALLKRGYHIDQEDDNKQQ